MGSVMKTPKAKESDVLDQAAAKVRCVYKVGREGRNKNKFDMPRGRPVQLRRLVRLSR